MIRTITIGEINSELHKVKIVQSPIINGRIEKIIVEFNNPSAFDSLLEIFSPDKELILSKQGADREIFYPRNWNVTNQKYNGINVNPSEGSYAEKWLVLGELQIRYSSSMQEDSVKDIIIVYEEVETQQDIKKDAGAVTTSTAGVYNPSYGGGCKPHLKESYLKKLIDLTKSEITKEESDINLIQNNLPTLKQFIEDSVFSKRFEGMNWDLSKQLKNYIVRAVVNDYNKPRVISYLTKTANISEDRADVIYRTETHELRNKTREWAYSKIDPEGMHKYQWIGPSDTRTTKICKNIQNRTKKGVSLPELKQIIEEESKKGMGSKWNPREFNPHPSCRHTYIRKFD